MMHKLSRSKKGGWLLIGPYDDELYTALMAFPGLGRRWDSVAKAWRISDELRPAVQRLLDERHWVVPDRPDPRLAWVEARLAAYRLAEKRHQQARWSISQCLECGRPWDQGLDAHLHERDARNCI